MRRSTGKLCSRRPRHSTNGREMKVNGFQLVQLEIPREFPDTMPTLQLNQRHRHSQRNLRPRLCYLAQVETIKLEEEHAMDVAARIIWSRIAQLETLWFQLESKDSTTLRALRTTTTSHHPTPKAERTSQTDRRMVSQSIQGSFMVSSICGVNTALPMDDGARPIALENTVGRLARLPSITGAHPRILRRNLRGLAGPRATSP